MYGGKKKVQKNTRAILFQSRYFATFFRSVSADEMEVQQDGFLEWHSN